MEQQLNELFAPPIGVKPVATIEGIKLYSSKGLVKKFVRMIEKTSRMRPYSKKLTKLINKGTVIPCFVNKGIVSWMKRKIFGGKGGHLEAYAFYYKPHKKVYVLIDAEMTAWGTAKNDQLLATTVHECMHVLANTKSKQYEKIFMPVLVKYYSTVFQELFQIKNINKKDIADTIKFIRKQARSSARINKILANIYYFMEKRFKKQSTLQPNNFLQKLQDYIVVSKIGSMDVPLSIIQKTFKERESVFRAFYNGYHKAFGKRPEYFNQMQEGLFTSEVASVFAEIYPHSPYVKKAMAAL